MISDKMLYQVIHILNPGCFFIRNSSQQEKFESLSKSLQKMELKVLKDESFGALTKALQKMDLHPQKDIKTQKVGAVKRHGHIHRGKVIEEKDKYAEVQLMDVGEIVAVHAENLYQLDEKFHAIPPLVTQCQFHELLPFSKDMGWTEMSRKILHDEVRGKFFQIRIYEKVGDIWSVDLLQGDKISIREHMINNKCGMIPKPKKVAAKKVLENPTELDIARNHKVVVTWVESPDQLSLIETQNFSILQELEKRLKRTYNKKETPQWQNSMGNYLIIKMESRFHRAKLLNTLTEKLHEVEIVDWGRIKFVDISQMFEVTDKDFYSDPPLSHKFKLTNLKPVSSKYGWTQTCTDDLRKFCESKKGHINMANEKEVRLFIEDVNVNEWLVNKKHAYYQEVPKKL